MNSHPTVGILLTLVLLGCGPARPGADDGATGPDTSGSEGTTDASAALPSPPGAWAEMTVEDKAGWMNAEVLPRMRPLFQEFDGERYALVSCATCHGPGAASGEFAMPSLHLPALPPTGSDEQHAMVRQYGPMLRFMFNRVLPTSQALVGGAPYDEATQTGFSCFSCHPRQGTEGSTMVHLEPEPAGG
ncbi:MAG: hypothetical protein AB7S26_10255 [Sandaracinaceae bacterium]